METRFQGGLCGDAKKRIIEDTERVTSLAIKVLLVDPAKVTDQLSRDTLVPLGCQIITASSTALGLFLARKNFPALIINGVRDSDEVDLPHEIKVDPDLAHIPVVVVANTGDESMMKRVRSSGAAKILTQPLSPEKFFEELRPFLVERKDNRPGETPE